MGSPAIHREVSTWRQSTNSSETTWRTPRYGRGKTICLKKSFRWLPIYYRAGQIWTDMPSGLSPVPFWGWFLRGGSGLVKLTMRQKAFTFRLERSVGYMDQLLLLYLKCLDIAHDVANALLHHGVVKPV